MRFITPETKLENRLLDTPPAEMPPYEPLPNVLPTAYGLLNTPPTLKPLSGTLPIEVFGENVEGEAVDGLIGCVGTALPPFCTVVFGGTLEGVVFEGRVETPAFGVVFGAAESGEVGNMSDGCTEDDDVFGFVFGVAVSGFILDAVALGGRSCGLTCSGTPGNGLPSQPYVATHLLLWHVDVT